MDRESFIEFTNAFLRAAILHAEDFAKKKGIVVKFSKPPAFRWLHHKELFTENIAETIAEKVWEAPDRIRPCVDLGVFEVLDDGTPVLTASIAGYPPQPFSVNWSGGVGPYVHCVGGAFMMSPDSKRSK